MKTAALLIVMVAIFWLSCPAGAELSINPPVSEVGSSVVISSSKGEFDDKALNNQITFSGQAHPVPAEWVSDDKNHLLVRVPRGTTDGPVKVEVKHKLIDSVVFKVKPPAGWPSLVVWLGILLALLARTILPYLIKKVKEGVKFDWKFLVPSIGGVILGFIAVFQLLPSIGFTGNPFQDFLAAFSVTYTSQDVIREFQKTAEPAKPESASA